MNSGGCAAPALNRASIAERVAPFLAMAITLATSVAPCDSMAQNCFSVTSEGVSHSFPLQPVPSLYYVSHAEPRRRPGMAAET